MATAIATETRTDAQRESHEAHETNQVRFVTFETLVFFVVTVRRSER